MSTLRVEIDRHFFCSQAIEFAHWCRRDREFRSVAFATKSDRSVSSEQRSEDPFVVSIDAVVRDYCVALAAAGDSEEGTVGVRRRIVAAGSGTAGFRVEHIRHARNQNSQRRKVSLRRGRHTSRINGQGANKMSKVLRGWAD